MPELEGVTARLLTLANKHDIPICSGRGTQLSDEKRKRYPDDSFYLKGPEEMAYLFPERAEALSNTLVIADMVDLNLTFDLNPIRHKLVFERFLNIERNEMPDIDTDFADNQRGAMIEYAAERYGPRSRGARSPPLALSAPRRPSATWGG